MYLTMGINFAWLVALVPIWIYLLHNRNKVLWTPLDCAAANGHARVIKELVSAKAEIDPTDKLKTTPLHLAAKEGHVTAVETLIKHGANVGLRDQRGFNALDWAIEKGHRYDIILKTCIK